MTDSSDTALPACLDAVTSAWEHVYRLQDVDGVFTVVTGGLRDSAEVSSVHKYLLACCRRIWPLIPESGSRMGVEAGEKYCRGEISWKEARETDWHSEGSAFIFAYNEDDDPAVAPYIAQISQDRAAIERLLVPASSFASQSVRELLTDAAYFANFALCYPAIRFGKQSKKQLQSYGKFMPLELFEAMVPAEYSTPR
ncbi:MAG: hypothetical protein AAAFM81_15605 [Pseudomonadota bacterium]